jgi:ABC-2 type transport system ATP-binding protein
MIITTHLVRDMEKIFDEVSFISDGEIILEGNAEKLREEKSMQIDDLYKEIFG